MPRLKDNVLENLKNYAVSLTNKRDSLFESGKDITEEDATAITEAFLTGNDAVIEQYLERDFEMVKLYSYEALLDFLTGIVFAAAKYESGAELPEDITNILNNHREV